MNTAWFTADSHFDHKNIIRYVKRPFSSINAMNDALINSWNAVVKPDDTVYHLGDFTLGDIKTAMHFFSQLNGEIDILTNTWHHDKYWLHDVIGKTVMTKTSMVLYLPPLWVLELKLDEQVRYPLALTLCHYPLASWERSHYGAWHLHGHAHGMYQGQGKILDVGVDNVYKLYGDYRPISIIEVIEYMNRK